MKKFYPPAYITSAYTRVSKYAILICALCCFAAANAQYGIPVCKGSNGSFTFPGGTSNTPWYTQQFQGNAVFFGQTLTVNNLTQSQTYWVTDAFNRTKVTFFAVDPPDASITTNSPVCLGSQMSLMGAEEKRVYCFLGNGTTYGAAAAANEFPLTATANLTMEAWVYWNGASTTQAIMYNGNAGSSGYGIYVDGTTKKLFVLAGGVAFITTNLTLGTGKWHHIAATCKLAADNVTRVWDVFLDGTDNNAIASNVNARPNAPSSGGFSVGQDNSGGARFNGKIDEVAFWTTARTSEDFALDMANNIATPQANLAGYWKFDDPGFGAVTTIGDNSGNGLDLMLTDNAAWTNAANYTWDLAGGLGDAGSFGRFMYTTYGSAGSKTVSFSVTDVLGCTASSNKTVYVSNTTPPAVTASASITSACFGSTTTLKATGGGLLVDNDFDNSTLPAGWTNNGWGSGATTYSITTPDNSDVWGIESQGQPKHGTYLQAPAFSTTGLSSLKILLNSFMAVSGANFGKVQVSTNNSTWTDVVQINPNHGNYNAFATDTFAIPAAFENKSTVYLRFAYEDDGSVYSGWWINYVKVYPGPVAPSFKWTSNPSGFSSNKQNPTTTINRASTIYSVVASNGCSSAASSITVTGMTGPTATVSNQSNINNPTGVCLNGTSPSVTFTGANGTAPYTFTYTIGNGPEQNISSGAGNTATLTVPTNVPGSFIYRIGAVTSTCTNNNVAVYTLVVVSKPTATISGGSTVCVGGADSIKIPLSGGIAPYEIDYKKSTDPFSIIQFQKRGTYGFLANTSAVGPYTYDLLSITDSIGCKQTLTGSTPVTVSGPSAVTVSTTPTATVTSTSFVLPYTITSGSPTLYSIVARTNNAMPGFTPVTNATLPGGNITVAIPQTAAGTYNFGLTVQQNAPGCVASALTPFNVTVLSNNNSLLQLSVNGATISPVFNPATTSYTASVPVTTASVGIFVANNESHQTIKINGIPVSNLSTTTVPLSGGTNAITVEVTAQDGTIKNHVVTITKPVNISVASVSTDAKVAYSLRKLTSAYLHAAVTPPAAVSGFTNSTTPLIRVRRSSDNALLDIGYMASGSLDTATLKSFAGTGNAYVTIWYDQSGNNLDAIQNTAASQPMVHSAGTMLRKNGVPAVYFKGSVANKIYLSTANFKGLNNGFSLFAAAGVKTDNAFNTLISKSSGNVGSPWDVYNEQFVIGDSLNVIANTGMPSTVSAATGFALWGFTGNKSSGNAYINGNANGTIANTSAAYLDGNTPLMLGTKPNLTTQLNGWISEAFVFASVLPAADRTAITANEKTLFFTPFIQSFTPVSAPAGTTITIKGYAFTGATAVSFGGTAAASFTVVNDTIITAVTGAGASGVVSVTTPVGVATKDGFFLGSPPGKAVLLNGTNQFVSVNTNGATVSGSFTVEAWVMPWDTVAAMNILCSRTGSNNSFDIKLQGGNQLHANIGNGSAWITTAADAAFTYTRNRWYHIAITVTTTGYTIYANGKVIGSGSYTGTPLLFDATHLINIGANNGTSEFFNGWIDEVRVYNAILTAAEIRADMGSTDVAKPANLQLYYNFDYANGAIITDFSGRNNTGTLNNNALLAESYAMVVPKIAAANVITPSGFTARWVAPVTGTVTKYLLDVATDAAFVNFVPGYNAKQIAVASTSQAVSGLADNTTYYYRVRADKTSVTGQGAYSDTASVTTLQTPPTITSFTPYITTAGNTVTITGTNFKNVTAVAFGGTAASSFTVNSTTQITAIVAVGASGAVSVTTIGGTALKTGFFIGAPPGNALLLNGSQYAMVTNSGLSTSFEYTVEAWVMPMDATKVMNIFSTRGTGANGDFTFDMKLQGGNKIHADIGDYNPNNAVKYTWATTQADATFNYKTGQWYHIAYSVSLSGQLYKIYVNGNLVGSGSLSAVWLPLFDANHTNAYIGSNAGNNAGEDFIGNIDEVRVYGRALTQANIQADMVSTSLNATSQKLYYNFDQLNGSTITDFAGSNYTGTLVGSPAFVESYAMVVPKTAASTGVTGAQFTANWNKPVTGTTDNYLLDVSKNNAFTNFVTGYNAAAVSDTTKTITGLLQNTKYYYRVRANKAAVNGQGANSNIDSVTTGAISAAINGATSVCRNASPPNITFTGLNGAAPYAFVYNINGGSSQAITTTAGNTATIAAPTGVAGKFVYTLVSVTDNSGNTQTLTNSVTVTIAAPTASTTSASVCSTDLPYTWNGIDYNAEGTYIAHLTNAAGCDSAATLVLTITQPTASTINVTICETDLPYNWHGLACSTAGTYTAHLTNAAGCDSAATLVLNVLASPSAIYTAAKYDICTGGHIYTTVKGTGGTAPYQYSLDGNAWQASGNFNVYEGTYTAIVKDANGCTAQSNTISINGPATPLELTLTTALDCPANIPTLTVDAAGGFGNYKYSIDKGTTWQNNNIFTGLAAGSAYVTVMDGNGCKTAKSIKLTIFAATYNTSKTQICAGNNASTSIKAINGTAPYAYSLDGVNFQAANTFKVSAGTYTATVKDAAGCSVVTNALTITSAATPLNLTLDAMANCAGDADTIIAHAGGSYGNYMYSLDNITYQNSNIFSGLDTGTYKVFVKDAGGCVTNKKVIFGALTATYTTSKNILCYGAHTGTVVKAEKGTQPYAYSLDGINYQTSGTFNVGAGTYAITVMDAKGCTFNTGTLALAQAPAPLAIHVTQHNVSCLGGSDGSVTVNLSGGYSPDYTYAINGEYGTVNMFSNLAAGLYKLTGRDSIGCTVNKNVTITQPGSPCESLTSGNQPTSSSAGTPGIKVHVLPNPTLADFKLTIEGGDDKHVVEIRVMDMAGKVVYHTRGSVHDQFSFGKNFAAGMYVAEVLNGQHVQTIKLMRGN